MWMKLNPLQQLIMSVGINARSHLMVRSKQQLKNELLMGFRKKHKQQVIDLQQTQERTQIYQTPMHSQHQNVSSFAANRSILEQFSRCPIRDDQYQYSGQQFLNKFMFAKNRVYVPTSAKTSVSVQTQKHVNEQHRNKYGDNSLEKQRNVGVKTPAKIKDFNEKGEKSLIDVSANLSTFKYVGSDNKYDPNKILTDSILQNSDKHKQSQDSAEQLLNELNGQNKRYSDPAQLLQDFHESADDIKDINQKQEREQKSTKQPIVKQISLSKLKKNAQIPTPSLKQELKENTSHSNYEHVDDDQQSEKLRKLLSKKSSIKSMIIKKNLQQQGKLKYASDPDVQVPDGKWGKPSKKYNSNEYIQEKYKPDYNQYQQDPLDLLPPYQSSSSGLQAVIQEQNESELEESIKHRGKYSQTIKHQDPRPKPNQNEANQAHILKIRQSQKLQHISQPEKQPIKQNKISQIKLINAMVSDSEVKDNVASVNQQKKQKRKESQHLKQISLSDLDLEDVSQIQHVSSNKDIQSTFKKQSKQLAQEELPDFHDSQNEDKDHKKQISLKKYIVNDISNDINNLKNKIEQDSSISREKLKQKTDSQKSSDKGSEGPDKKTSSMLDFFDQIHDKIDFKQISKDIIDLKDRIERDSQ